MRRPQMPGLYLDLVKLQLKALGFKGVPSGTLVDSLASLKHDARNSLVALMKSGYKYYNDFGLSDSNLSSALYLLDAERDTPSKYLDVFMKLKEQMGYKTVHVANDAQLYQVDNIYKISRFKGDVCKAIDVLAEVGFSLRAFSGKKILLYEELDVIHDLAQMDADKFLKTFYRLKKKLGYKTINVQFPKSFNKNSMVQIEKIIELSGIGNICEAIDAFSEWRNLDVDAYGKDNSLHSGGLRIDEKRVDKLPPWGDIDLSHDFKKYKIDSKKGLTNKDVEIIKYLSDQLWKDALVSIRPCFYKEDSEKFVECFQQLDTNDKKRVIRAVFKCDKASNEEIITWLDENYPELVREVGLSLI